MKKSIGMLVGILVLVSAMGSVNAQIIGTGSTGNALLITNLTIPAKIYPGENFTLSFRVKNTWREPGSVEDAYVYLEGGEPFMKVSPSEPQLLKGLGYSSEWWLVRAVPVNFNLSVDRLTTSGTYSLNAVLVYSRFTKAIGVNGATEKFREVIPIRIRVLGIPEISLFVKSSSPAKLRAGDMAQLSIKAANTGSAIAKNVLVFFGQGKDVKPLWNSRVVYMGDILPGMSGTGGINIQVDQNVPSGMYEMPFKIKYLDEEAGWVERNGSLGIKVSRYADFKVNADNVTVFSNEKDARIVYFIKNTGTRVAKEIRVTLIASYPFTPTGGEYFLDRLLPDEKKEIYFHVDVDKDASEQKYPVNFFLKWNENNTEYSLTQTSYISVKKEEERMKFYALYGLLVIVALAVSIKVIQKVKK
ncbi:hypothetical protein BMS3Bbin15_00326 [archaeon BMS3Bbin15]|nr:hypothetical protein BMS3Bbin15_00326 [archaeon BMS3Bbin15]